MPLADVILASYVGKDTNNMLQVKLLVVSTTKTSISNETVHLFLKLRFYVLAKKRAAKLLSGVSANL